MLQSSNILGRLEGIKIAFTQTAFATFQLILCLPVFCLKIKN